MPALKADSLERYLTLHLSLVALALFGLGIYGLMEADWSTHWVVLLGLQWALVLQWYFRRLSARLLTTFQRTALHLEAIDQEDYNQWSKPVFSEGSVAEIHRQLGALSQELGEKKSRYDRHVLLIYQLIEQLDTPVLVFDERGQLSFANQAFEWLYHRPWQMYRYSSAKYLGLVIDQGHWQFKDDDKNRQWQIRHSEFSEGEGRFQLLVFIDIGSALRKSQLDAWQQIIRVLSHEIRNSLTPVSSLAESLGARAELPRDQKALSVIAERCTHLQDFVSRYADITKKPQLSCRWVALEPLLHQVLSLFKSGDIQVDNREERLWGDGSFIEQVLINLIKNALEAGANQVALMVDHHLQQTRLRVKDDGTGIANPQNLFVPLYTTKPQGQGIGLSFCRNIVEQHAGTISLENNEGKGALVTVLLPRPTS